MASLKKRKKKNPPETRNFGLFYLSRFNVIIIVPSHIRLRVTFGSKDTSYLNWLDILQLFDGIQTFHFMDPRFEIHEE